MPVPCCYRSKGAKAKTLAYVRGENPQVRRSSSLSASGSHTNTTGLPVLYRSRNALTEILEVIYCSESTHPLALDLMHQ